MTATAERQTMTAERFAQGKTWAEWVDGIQANKPKFIKNHEDFTPHADDVAFFKAYDAKKGLKVVAIGEDWCPDVVRGMPVIARLCEEAGLDLRIFDRDKNMDLTNEFLWRHKFMCIPVFVLYDKDWNELGHWIEKPASAYKWSADIRTELKTAGLSDEEILPKLRELRAGLEPQWMHDTVGELRHYILSRVL